MITNAVDSSKSGCQTSFGERREPLILGLMLMAYVVLSFGLWGSFEVQFDSPAYTDPAASYIMGQGFTSGCWYFQGPDEFWAGNVPLHSLLLIPWFKAFGFSADSVWALNMIYLVAAIGLLWRTMAKMGVIPSARWRLAAIAFFLATRSCLSLVITRRPEPLCFLILSAAWYCLTLERPARRWIGLALCGVVAVWTALNLAMFFALAGIGALLFYGRRYFREVVALAVGGVIGAVTLLGFYYQAGALDLFVMNISPHIGAIHNPNIQISEEFADFLAMLHSWQGRLAGALDPLAFILFGLSAWVMLVAWITGRSRRLATLNMACAVAVPAALAITGVFAAYYNFLMTLPVTIMLFALLREDGMRARRESGAIRWLLWLSVALPSSYLWCSAVQAVPSLWSHRDGQMKAFLQEVIRADDVVWVEPRFWFATKPLARQVFSGLWKMQARTGQGREAITVAIDYRSAGTVKLLPGHWEPTGEVLRLPDFHRFYRVQNNAVEEFLVFRKVDRR